MAAVAPARAPHGTPPLGWGGGRKGKSHAFQPSPPPSNHLRTRTPPFWRMEQGKGVAEGEAPRHPAVSAPVR